MFALLALVALAGVAAVLTIGGSSTSPSASRLASKSAFHSDGVLSPPRAAPPLVLDNYLGRPVNIDAYRGKAVLVTFLYTHCPDACPLTAMHINDALGSLGARRNHVVVLAISVDPKGDTPSAVGTFVRTHRLRTQFHYLTGSTKALERVWRLYNVSAVRNGGPDVDHTLYTLVLDRSGKSRVLFDSLAKPATMAHDVGLLLG